MTAGQGNDQRTGALVLSRPRGATMLAVARLDQRVAAGVGNVFKSEAAFVAGLDPFAPIGSLSDDEVRRVWDVAHRQLVANRPSADRPSRGRTTTRAGAGGRLYVYGRARAACRLCGSTILYSPAGRRTERSTYWCPTCQPARSSGTGDSG